MCSARDGAAKPLESFIEQQCIAQERKENDQRVAREGPDATSPKDSSHPVRGSGETVCVTAAPAATGGDEVRDKRRSTDTLSNVGCRTPASIDAPKAALPGDDAAGRIERAEAVALEFGGSAVPKGEVGGKQGEGDEDQEDDLETMGE